MFNEAGLKDKYAIVTGGSRGIGCAIVNVLAEAGVDVTFFYHNSAEQAQIIQKDLTDKGLRVTAMQVDVCDKDACDNAVESIFERTDRIDILVNNSGIVRDNLLVGLTKDEIQAVIDTNILGVFHMTQATTPFMMRQRYGKIINMSSASGEKGGRGQVNYAATKGAVNAFTKALAVELAPRKITVNAVAPGIIETDMSRDVREMAGDETLSKILLKRYGQPEDVAYAVAFLASRYADYITGEILHVDGGFKMA